MNDLCEELECIGYLLDEVLMKYEENDVPVHCTLQMIRKMTFSSSSGASASTTTATATATTTTATMLAPDSVAMAGGNFVAVGTVVATSDASIHDIESKFHQQHDAHNATYPSSTPTNNNIKTITFQDQIQVCEVNDEEFIIENEDNNEFVENDSENENENNDDENCLVGQELRDLELPVLLENVQLDLVNCLKMYDAKYSALPVRKVLTGVIDVHPKDVKASVDLFRGNCRYK